MAIFYVARYRTIGMDSSITSEKKFPCYIVNLLNPGSDNPKTSKSGRKNIVTDFRNVTYIR